MKKITSKIPKGHLYAIVGSLVLIIVVAVSCKKQAAALFSSPENTAAPRQNIQATTATVESNCSSCSGIWTPKNIRVEKVAANRINILNNDEFRYVGLNLEGKLIAGLSGISLSCTCTSGSGCSPGISGDSYACVMGASCSACNSLKSGLLPGSVAGQYESVGLKTGGFIRKLTNVHFATKNEVLEQPFVFAAMAEVAEIKQAVKEFETKYGGIESVRVLVSVAGRTAILTVNRSSAELNQAIILTAKSTCSCSDGTCEYSKIIGLGEGCKAKDCKGTCTLSTGLKIGENTLDYQSFQF